MKTGSLSAHLCSGGLKDEDSLTLIVAFRFFHFEPYKTGARAGWPAANHSAVWMTDWENIPHIVAGVPSMPNGSYSANFATDQSHSRLPTKIYQCCRGRDEKSIDMPFVILLPQVPSQTTEAQDHVLTDALQTDGR